MTAQIIDRQPIYDRWSKVTEALLRLPNGAVETRIVEDHGCAAAILLYNPERRVALLVTQPRAPVLECGEAPVLEVVAGRAEHGSDEATAKAEALEEAGVMVRDVQLVATAWSLPAVSTERISLFLAEYQDRDRIGLGGGAATENECIEVVEIALTDLWAIMERGHLVDAKTLTLVQALKIRRPDLFS